MLTQLRLICKLWDSNIYNKNNTKSIDVVMGSKKLTIYCIILLMTHQKQADMMS